MCICGDFNAKNQCDFKYLHRTTKTNYSYNFGGFQ